MVIVTIMLPKGLEQKTYAHELYKDEEHMIKNIFALLRWYIRGS